MCLCTTCVQVPQRQDEGIKSPRAIVIGSYELQYWCWELILGHL